MGHASVADLGSELWHLEPRCPGCVRFDLRVVAVARLPHDFRQRLGVGAQPDTHLCPSYSSRACPGHALPHSTGKLGTPFIAASLVRRCLLHRSHNIAWFDALCGVGWQAGQICIRRLELTDARICDQLANLQEFVFVKRR